MGRTILIVLQGVCASRQRLFLILMLGFALRMFGVHFGLPDLYHADEPIVVNHALAYGMGDFNPHFFKIPPLVSYLLFLCYGFFYCIGYGIGNFQNTDEFLRLFLTDPSSFYFIARLIFGVFFGTLTIYIFYRFVKKNFSADLGLISAYLLATNFLHVRDSHFIYTDIPLVLVLVLSLKIIFDVFNGAGLKTYLFFACLGGAAVATKYNGMFIWVPFLTAHFIRNGFSIRSFFAKRLWASGFVSIAVFFLLNPFAAIDFHFFLKELHGQSGAEGFTGWTHHLTYSLAEGMGIFILLLFFLGTVFAIFKRDPKGCILLSFVAVYYTVLVIFAQPYDRYVLPLVPFVIFFAAQGIVQITGKFKCSKWLCGSFILLLSIPSLGKIYLSNRIFMAEDKRSTAKKWVETHIPEGEKIALEEPFFMPRLKPTAHQLQKKRMEKEISPSQKKRIEVMIEDAIVQPAPRYELYFLSDQENESAFLFSKPKLPYRLDEVKRQKIHYVLVSKQGVMKNKKFYAELKQEGKLLIKFSPFKDPAREEPIDRMPLTGGPFLWTDLIGRTSNGQIIEVYQLQSSDQRII